MFTLKDEGTREESRSEKASKKRGGTLAEGSMWKVNNESISKVDCDKW